MNLTIGSVFFASDSFGAAAADAVERSRTFTQLRERPGTIPGAFFNVSRDAVTKAVRQALDIPITSVVFRAMALHQRLKRAVDAQTDPTATMTFALGVHRITSSHRPHIEMRFMGAPVGILELDLRLKLETESIVLHIQNRHVIRITAGRCVGSATVSLDGLELPAPTSVVIPLPGDVDLKGGFPLPL